MPHKASQKSIAIVTLGLAIGVFGYVGTAIADPETVRIDSSTANGVTTERHYDQNQVFFKSVAISSEGDTTVYRTTNNADMLIEIQRITETPDASDSTTIHREIRTKRYTPDTKRPFERTVRTELEGLVNFERTIRQRTTTTETYEAPDYRNLIKTQTEEIELLEVEDSGRLRYGGTRTTQIGDADPVVETLDLNTSTAQQEDNQAQSETDLPEEIETEVRTACQTIERKEVYGFAMGPIEIDGDWRAATTAAVDPHFSRYENLMRNETDIGEYKFGQVNGFYKQLAYSTLIGTVSCNLAVLRHRRHFPRNEVDQARNTACDLRGYLARVFQEEKAQTVAEWKPTLIELDDIDPCN